MKAIFSNNAEWSQWMATSQAAPLLGKSADGLRGWIRSHAAGRDDFELDGAQAKRLGRLWRVRVHRSWVQAPDPAPQQRS